MNMVFDRQSLYPLSDLIEQADFPLGTLIPSDILDTLFGNLFYSSAEAYSTGDSLFIRLTLLFETELTLTPPGTDAISLVIASSGQGWSAVEAELEIGSNVSIALLNVPIAIRFSEGVLKDVATGNGAELTMTATLRFSSDMSLSLETDASLSLSECEIAGTSITMSAIDIQWNFQPGQTIPDAVAAGLSGEFIGIAFRQVTVKLPRDLADAPELSFDYCCIGTGGFTGGITAAFATPATCKIGEFSVKLHHIAIRFQESRLIKGEIEAVLENLPFFDSEVTLTIQLAAEGGLRIALRGDESLLKLEKPDVIAMMLTSAELIVDQEGGAMRLSGTITPLFTLPGGSDLPGFNVKALTITSKDQVSVDGGSISLPDYSNEELGPLYFEM